MKKLWKNYSINFTTSFQMFCLSAMFVVAISCGHRKTELSKTETKKDTFSSVLKEQKIKVDSNYAFDFSMFKIYPIDFTKPIIINGNTIVNASIEGTKKIEYGTLQKTTEIKEKEIKKGSTQTEIKTKQTEKSDYTILWIGIAFVIVAGVVIYIKKDSLIF